VRCAVLCRCSNLLLPLLNLLLPAGSPHVPTYLVALFGKYLCYALLALAIDLIWGYCGILSLGHGAFFALGGYAMGMYLMRQIGTRGVYGNPILPDFMVFLNWKELPWYWYGFDISGSRADGAAGAGRARLRVRLVRVPLARHRRLSLDHHAGDDLRAAARLLPQRHFGFGGNNGLTDFKDILGFNVQARRTRARCSR
jgi:urea transport system permease protein